MEHTLTCNNLKCRSELTDHALVTTCSHIFCVNCADSLGVTDQTANRRTSCPACKSQLSNPDDAVITNLKPSEEYKTSVLSGLSPNVIMECAGRALGFWAYQATQDICYQQFLYKTMSEKYSGLHIQLDKTVNDANTEIESLQQKLQDLMAEHDAMRRKNEELAAKYNDKNRKLLQTQELYDRVKRQAERGDMQRAAADTVDSTLHASQAHPSTLEDTWNSREWNERYQPPPFGQTPRHHVTSTMNTGASRANPSFAGIEGRWARQELSQRNESNPTPIGGVMRQRLGVPTMTMAPPPPPAFNAYRGTLMPDHSSTRRPTDPGAGAPDFAHNRSGLNGIGLTSGLKVSQPASVAALDTSRRNH